MTLRVPFDAAAPPEDTWGPMLVVALLVVAVVAMILGFGRITRRRRVDRQAANEGGAGSQSGRDSRGSGSGSGTSTLPEATASDNELPTDPG